MKNKLIVNSLRTVKMYFPRFISLFIMSLLGVFVFSGLCSTGPDMINTLDKYLKDRNSYDLKVVSNMGLTKDDIDFLKSINTSKLAEGSYSKDVLVSLKDFYVINVSSIPQKINLIKVTSGKYPINNNEILVEERLIKENNLKIGDLITIDAEVLKETKYKIVGTVSSSLYFNNATATHSRGNTNIGTGTINYYAYTLESNFNIDYYTSAYISIKNRKMIGTNDYHVLLDKTEDILNGKKSIREKKRYDEIYNEAFNKIQSEEQKANNEFLNAEKNFSLIKNELDNNKFILDNTLKELDNASILIESLKIDLDNTKTELDNKKIELDNFQEILDKNFIELNQYKDDLEKIQQELNLFNDNLSAKKEELDEMQSDYLNTIEKLNLTEDSIDDKILEISNYLFTSEENDELRELLNTLLNLKEQKQIISNYYLEYDSQLKVYNDSYNEYMSKKQLYDEGMQEYYNNLNIYNEGLLKYNNSLNTYNNFNNEYEQKFDEYNKSKSQYEQALVRYNDGLNQYTINYNSYLDNKAKIEKEIKNSYDELKKIEMPKWYITSLKDYSTYAEYIDDTNSITNLSKIFPILFFSVAILISLISMNRMVENDRLEIGTLKSLGFSNIHILSKYLIFSFIATLFGVINGGILGSIIIPKMIFSIYKVLFELPELLISLNIKYTLIGSIISFLCICGTTVYTVNKVLKEKPSELIRPKSPKNGKRVLFEKFKFWKNISFSRKVIIRNILRYKKRVLVTIFGIAGCTALIVCGFGIKDSIVDIANTQYGKIFLYDGIVYINGELENNLLENSKINDIVKIQNISAKVLGNQVNVLISESDEDLKKIVNLNSITNKETYLEDNKVIITEKLATMNNLKIGDIIEIENIDNNINMYEISDIVENHLNHYVFMNKNTYKNFKYNTIYFKSKKLSNNQKEKLSSDLLKYKNVINVIYVSDLKNSVLNMLKSLDQVVLILIVLASLLAFVVLYNLSNININERKREIATLKVLGFYNKEVDDYITKENIFLSIVGIIIGLFIGYFLTNVVISTVEIEKARFIRGISINSYIISALIAMSFTIIVNIFTHFSLKKIDMVESLKSVE